ncbi:MAG TPA: mechanosensitive ion channel family protein, partial [Roseiflexaceae bacterium]|nr:mechanosensitive ion channel family protein [Roseiflexaceae bacterium]
RTRFCAMMLQSLLPEFGRLSYYVLRAALTFLVAAIVARILSWTVWRLELSRLALAHRPFSDRRRTTLRSLVNSLMNGLAVLVTLISILAMFVQPGSLVTALGLFSAGIGFAARPYISDFLGGIVLLFEDQFALGDKVEIGDRNVIGVVERVSLRTIHIRGESGELWIVPNGDVRTIRNFTRGSFSPANIKLSVPTNNLDETLELLSSLIADPGPDVIEPPEIISEAGEIGERTVLMLKVKATHGKGPEVRRRLLAQIQSEMTHHGILAGPHE